MHRSIYALVIQVTNFLDRRINMGTDRWDPARRSLETGAASRCTRTSRGTVSVQPSDRSWSSAVCTAARHGCRASVPDTRSWRTVEAAASMGFCIDADNDVSHLHSSMQNDNCRIDLLKAYI